MITERTAREVILGALVKKMGSTISAAEMEAANECKTPISVREVIYDNAPTKYKLVGDQKMLQLKKED